MLKEYVKKCRQTKSQRARRTEGTSTTKNSLLDSTNIYLLMFPVTLTSLSMKLNLCYVRRVHPVETVYDSRFLITLGSHLIKERYSRYN